MAGILAFAGDRKKALDLVAESPKAVPMTYWYKLSTRPRRRPRAALDSGDAAKAIELLKPGQRLRPKQHRRAVSPPDSPT